VRADLKRSISQGFWTPCTLPEIPLLLLMWLVKVADSWFAEKRGEGVEGHRPDGAGVSKGLASTGFGSGL